MNRHSIKLSLLSALLISLFSFTQVQAQKFTAKYNTSIAPNSNGFYEYLPQGYSSTGTTLYPLLIFIHGMGEYGSGSATSLPAILKHGTPRYIKEGTFPTSFSVGGKTFKFIVLAPQWKSQASTSNVNSLIDYAITHYKVDAKRIYITGLSAGGGVVENTASSLTVGKRLAAAVEFCGTTNPSSTGAANIISNNVAFWGLHNDFDNIVSSSKTKNWVGYIKSKKSTFPAIKTIFNTSGHNCWYTPYHANWRYNNLSIYEWMLQHQRGTAPSTSTNTPPVANAGSDKTITLPTNYTTLTGKGTDVNGTISKYAWSKVSGPSSYAFSSTTTASTTAKSLVAGTYVFRLTVTDNAGAKDYDDVKVVVSSSTTSSTTTYTKKEAENYSSMKGVQKETTSDAGGGYDVGYIDNTDWMEYSISVSKSGTYNVVFRLASGVTGGKFDVLNSSGTTLASISVPNTGGFQSWRDVKATIKLVSGTQTLMLYSTATPRWNINYFKYALSGGTTTSTALASGEGTVAIAEKTATITNDIAVAPNPFSDKFVLQVNSSNTGAMKVELVDASGVVRKTFQLTKNVAGTTQTYLSAGTLPAGNYFVKVTIGDWSKTTQVVKL